VCGVRDRRVTPPNVTDALVALSDTDRFAIFLTWGQQCVWCKRPLTFREMEIDHLIPKSLNDYELAEALALHGLPETYAVESKSNLAPSCHICNQNKARRLPPAAPAMTLLLETAKKLESEVEKRATSFAARKGLDHALGVVLATAAAGGLDNKAREQLREALDVIAPSVIETGALAPDKEVALHPAMQKVWGAWSVVTALSDEVALVTDGKRAGYVGTDISWMCSRCQSYGPWKGIICQVCGSS
jgi:5-methylcytosine-specific restriction endonuclease McrA